MKPIRIVITMNKEANFSEFEVWSEEDVPVTVRLIDLLDQDAANINAEIPESADYAGTDTSFWATPAIKPTPDPGFVTHIFSQPHTLDDSELEAWRLD